MANEFKRHFSTLSTRRPKRKQGLRRRVARGTFYKGQGLLAFKGSLKDVVNEKILPQMRNKTRLVTCVLFVVLSGYLFVSDSLFLHYSATATGKISDDTIFDRTRPAWSGVEKHVEYEFIVDGKTYSGSGFIKVPLQNNAFPIHYIPNNPSISRTDFPSPTFWAIGFLLSCIGVVLVLNS